MWIRIPRVVIPWVVLLLTSLDSKAQEPSSASALVREQLVGRALESNVALNLQRGRYDIANAGRRAAAGWPDPVVGTVFAPAPVYTARGTQQYQFRIEQPLPKPGDLPARRSFLNRTAEAEQLSVDVQALDIAYAVRAVFIEMMKASEMREVIRAFQRDLRSFETIAAAQYEVGAGSQQAIISAQLEHNKLDLELIRLDELLETHRQSLVALGALASGDSPALQEGYPPRDLTENTLPGHPPVERPELARYAVLEARESAVVAQDKASLWPEIRLQLSYAGIATADLPASADGRDAFAIGIGAKLPLWRERVHARIGRAEARRRQIDLEREAFLVELEQKLATVRAGLRSVQQQLKMLREQLLPQAETTLEIALGAYRTGQAGFLDLLEAQRSRFELRARELELTAKFEDLQARLIRETGADPLVTEFQGDQ